MKFSAAAGFLFVVAIASSCHLALGLGGLEIVDGEGGSATGMGGTGAGGMEDGGGGATPSCDVDNCPGVNTDCNVRACIGDMCDPAGQNLDLGTQCDDGGEPTAKVCDGDGDCVDCNTSADCNDAVLDTCIMNLCVAAACADGEMNGMETDIDCGGPQCAPCGNGLGCDDGTDCVSGYCNGGVCAACGGDPDCSDLPDHYCMAGVCEPRLANGSICGAANQCSSGFCVDDESSQPQQICCDSACNGTCDSCFNENTNGGNGNCLAIDPAAIGGPDPYNECAASMINCDTGVCSGTAMACGKASNGALCRNAGANPTCDPAETCNNGSCPANNFPGSGVSCGSAFDDDCTDPDSCDGAGNCDPRHSQNGLNCNVGEGECFVQDTCDGNGACTNNGFQMAGFPCGMGMTCNGIGNCT